MHTIAISIVALAMVQGAGQQVAPPEVGEPPAVREEGQGIPAIPATPAPAGEILWARAFEVEEPWTSDFRADHPTIRHGFIVVLKTDAAMAFPRQVACPVLMAGEMPCEVIDPVAGSEYVVALAVVPNAAEAWDPEPDFTTLDLCWCAPALPEQVTPESAAKSFSNARTAGVIAAWQRSRGVDPLAPLRSVAADPTSIRPMLAAADREAVVRAALAGRESILAR